MQHLVVRKGNGEDEKGGGDIPGSSRAFVGGVGFSFFPACASDILT